MHPKLHEIKIRKPETNLNDLKFTGILIKVKIICGIVKYVFGFSLLMTTKNFICLKEQCLFLC